MLTPARVRPAPLALLAALAVLLSTLLTGTAQAADTGSLTIRLQGLVDGVPKRVTAACFDVFGYENGNPGLEVRRHVCEVQDDVLELTGLPVPSDGRYLVRQTNAPWSVLDDDDSSPWVQELQFGLLEPFDAEVGEEVTLQHEVAGSAVVNRVGASGEDDDRPLEQSVGCYYVQREHAPGELGQRRGPFCGTEVGDLEPDWYRFDGMPFDDHLGGSTRAFVSASVRTVVDVEAPVAPDLRVRLVDPDGTPLTGVCFHVLAVDVPGWEAGDQVEVGCDSYPAPNDGSTTIVDLTPGRYTLVQRWAPNGYRAAADREVTVHSLPLACPATECPTPNAVTVTNLPLPVVDVLSTGPDGTPAAGGCWEAGRQLTGWFQVAARACDADEGGSDGHTVLRGLDDGTWTLRASTTPAGLRPAADRPVVLAGQDVAVTVQHERDGNRAPVAAQDSAVADEDGTVAVDVLANDVDPDGDPLTVALGTGPAHGTVALGADGRLQYAPAADWHGEDSLTYTVTDGPQTSTGTVRLTVRPVNDAPVTVDDAATTPHGTAVPVAVLGNDRDVDRDPLTATVSTQPAHGTVTAGADGRLVYTPAAGFSGTDAFTYAASDGTASTSGTVRVQVAAGAGAPPAGVDAQVAAVRALLAEVPAPHGPRLVKRLDKLLAEGGSGCTPARRLLAEVTGPAVVRVAGEDLASRLEDAVGDLVAALGCTAP